MTLSDTYLISDQSFIETWHNAVIETNEHDKQKYQYVRLRAKSSNNFIFCSLYTFSCTIKQVTIVCYINLYICTNMSQMCPPPIIRHFFEDRLNCYVIVKKT